jgi:hypothetical protein
MTRNPSEMATDETIYHEKDARPFKELYIAQPFIIFRVGLRRLFLHDKGLQSG